MLVIELWSRYTEYAVLAPVLGNGPREYVHTIYIYIYIYVYIYMYTLHTLPKSA